jgi:16S rRNA (cytosine967-C5)-methyltransferase
MPVENGLGSRRAALAILEQVRAGRPFDAALDQALEPLSDPDRRLAHELAAGVLRQRNGLDERLGPLAARGWSAVPPTLQNILRLGAYQLTALDRVPPHAAVSTSVELAREAGGARAGGFVNALLRRLGRQAPRKRKGTGPLDLAARHSHPEWLVRRWLDRFGPDDTDRLLRWNNARPALVLQPARATSEAISRRLAAAGIRTTPAPWGAGVTVAASRPDRLPGYADGDFVVQDPAQSLIAWFAGVPPAGLAYDACAAPGGKSIGLARTGVRVLAADLSRPRVARLKENLRRAGGGRELIVVADARHPPLAETDVVLLDVPCLGTGTFARHPDARWRVTPDALVALVERQTELLAAVAEAVRPGGWLVYATCSLEPEENELQIERFLRTHAGFRRDPPDDLPPPLLTDKGDLMTLPQRDRMDGAYAARLRRAG